MTAMYCTNRGSDGCMDHEPEENLDLEEDFGQEGNELTLIDIDTFFDMLMEQQEQM